MKSIFKLLLLSTAMLFLYSSCKKVPELPFYSNGTAPVLSSSATNIAPPTADSNKTIITFSWTSPNYATDTTTQKFIVEVDSSGRNFAKEVTFTVTGTLSKVFLAKEINTILLGFGFAYNKPYDVDVRVTSSYANNNEQYQSNVLKLSMTPYLVPPKVAPPASNTLFITGSATAGGWQPGGGIGAPAPAQQFKRIDSVTYEGTFYLNGGQQYVLLPVNGDWGSKYAVQDNSVAGLSAGGDFGFNVGQSFSSNIPAPAATGMYKITVDFQHGKYTVTPVGSSYGLLYVPGDYQGWTPASAPTLGSPKNDGNYEGYINIPVGGTNEFKLTTTPDFTNALGDGGAGTLSPGGGNLSVPGPGFYHIVANTTAKTWSATKITTFSLIGSFPASGWNNDVDMTYSAANNNWTGTITTVAGDQFKFRANHGWELNYGETNNTGSLSVNGDNIGDPAKNYPVAPGSHTVTLFLNNSGYFTYRIQ